jgi:putative tryptophan/tyrosine transport system substrate-binding protein
MLLAGPLTVEAQQTKVSRIGLLGIGSAEQSPFFEAFRQGLRERGWIEGQNVVFEDRSRVEGYDRLPEVAAELVRLKVDVIVPTNTTGAIAAKKATGTVPIVAMMAADPVQVGLVASLGRPAGNVTGLASFGRELMAKRLELLRETFPGVSRIAVLWNSESRTEVFSVKDAEAAAMSLGLRVQVVEVRRPEDFEKAFTNMMREHAGALVPASSSLFRAHRGRVVELAIKHRLPSIFDSRPYVEAGGLMSYGSDTKAIFRGLASYVDRILKGAKPGDLPIEQPTKLELVINLKTARTLGLTIPPAVLARADEAIQ